VSSRHCVRADEGALIFPSLSLCCAAPTTPPKADIAALPSSDIVAVLERMARDHALIMKEVLGE